MTAMDRWLAQATLVYRGEDDGQLFNRAYRVTGDVDRTVVAFVLLEELRAIRLELRQLLSPTTKDRRASHGR